MAGLLEKAGPAAGIAAGSTAGHAAGIGSGIPAAGQALGVRYLAELQDVTGCSGETVLTESTPTVGELLDLLVRRHGEPLRGRVLDTAGTGLADGVFILVNGRHLSQLQGLNTRLASGDMVSLIPVIEFG